MSALLQHAAPRLDGRTLGRHIQHDPQSRLFALPEPARCGWRSGKPRGLSAVEWTRRARVFDQGQIGMCTGAAMAGIIGTDSLGRGGDARVTEDTALSIYELATTLDTVPGHYPPDDTGSTGLAVMKAAQQLKFVHGYRHAFSLNAALKALDQGPCIVGITWLSDLERPRPDGLASYSGYPAGGHEIALVGRDPKNQTVTFQNSWGPDWGVDGGKFLLSWDDFATALKAGGDVTQPAGYFDYQPTISEEPHAL